MATTKKETIGECELCGRVDHHLVECVCNDCVTKFRLDKPENNLPRKAPRGRLVSLNAHFPGKR